MAILVAGDLHGILDLKQAWSRLSSKKNFRRGEPRHYLIAFLDFGTIWDSPSALALEEQRIREHLESLPCETLVVVGRHSGQDRVFHFPRTVRFGAPVQRISEKVSILQFGSVYCLQGLRFLVLAGAPETPIQSLDRPSGGWWPSEYPSERELTRARSSVEAHATDIDYVLSYDSPEIIERYSGREQAKEVLNLKQRLNRRAVWYFAEDQRNGPPTYQCLYGRVRFLPRAVHGTTALGDHHTFEEMVV